MATNPRLPDQDKDVRRGPMLLQKPEPPRSAVPGVILAIVTALLLLGAIFYFMPRAPKAVQAPAAAEAPAQPVPGELQFSDMHMTLDPTGKAIDLDGQVTNSGNETITGMLAAVAFTLKDGRVVNVSVPVQGVDLGTGKNGGRISGSVKNLVNDPIKPGAQRAIEINVSQVPEGWNHQMPGLSVSNTTGTAGK